MFDPGMKISGDKRIKGSLSMGHRVSIGLELEIVTSYFSVMAICKFLFCADVTNYDYNTYGNSETVVSLHFLRMIKILHILGMGLCMW